MSLTALAFLISSCLYTGFQWTIRLVVYPQFTEVPDTAFARYERMHQRRVSVAVGPLFVSWGVAALALLARPPAATARLVPLVAALLVGLVLAVTAFGAVPLHSRLSEGFDAAVHRRLLAVDGVRLALSVAASAVAVYLIR
ncbi:hypothetical protein BH10ACT8_BH10ACT8_10560 [soil metagenome]